MKKTTVYLLIIAFLLSNISDIRAVTTIPFVWNEKSKQITILINGRETALSSDSFRYVRDWSDDYSRDNKGTGVLCNNKIIFRGAINPDQSFVFIYDLKSQKIDVVEGVTKLIVDENFGWAVTKEYPTYSIAAESKEVSIIANGKKILEINRDDLNDIKWDKASGCVIILVKPGNP
jgi:hypothetical protein